MKKQFLDFNKFHYQTRKRFLPKIGLRFARTAAYLSDGGEGGEDPDSAKTEVEAIQKIGKQVENFTKFLGDKADKTAIKELTDQVAELQKSIETMQAADVQKMLDSINTKNEALWKQIVELQEEAAKDKEKTEGSAKKGPAFTRKQVEDFVNATFKDGIKTKDSASIKIDANKAAEIFGYGGFFDGGADTDISAFTGRVIDPTLYQRKRKRNLILDNFTIRRIDVPKLIYLVKVEDGDDSGTSAGDSGGAAWISSGEIKPMRSFRVTTGEVEAKKVAIFGTVEDKLLRDVPSLERWLKEDFADEMKEETNDGLLNNNPAVNDKAPLGMKTNAIQYSPTPAYNNAFTADSTNYIDQIFAIAALMSFNKEQAGKIFVATDIYHRIMHLKDTQGRYQNNNLVYTDSLGRLYIAGVEIVEADEEDVPSTHVLATAVDLGFKIYAYGPLVFERGLNGEDFRYDRTSFRGYQEFLSYIPEQRENSVLYDTWANVKAAIEA